GNAFAPHGAIGDGSGPPGKARGPDSSQLASLAHACHFTHAILVFRMTTPPRSGDHSGVDYPELAARTRRFSCGTPRAVTVSADGTRVIFVRSPGPEDPADQLWVFDVPSGTERLIADPATLPAASPELAAEERALRERMRLTTEGIGSFATDAAGAVAVFPFGRRVWRADPRDGPPREVPVAGPALR